MINLIRADLYRLKKMASIKICFIICLLSAVGIAIILREIYTGAFSLVVSTNASLLVDIMMVSLLGGVLVGSFIADDFDSKNVHSEIACGRGRLAIIISKMISYMIIIVLISLPYAVVSVIGFASGIDFAPLVGIPSSFFDVLSNVSQVDLNGENIAKSILVCSMIMYLYIARLSICLPIAFKYKKNVPVIVVGFISAFLFDIILALSTDVSGLSDFLSNLPYALTSKMTLDASGGMILKAFICSTIFILIMVYSSYKIFKRDEIK